MRTLTLLISFVSVLFVVSCGLNDSDTEDELLPPVIESVTANPMTVAPEDTSIITVTLQLERIQPRITYTIGLLDGGTILLPSGGRASGTGGFLAFSSGLNTQEVTWVAPDEVGEYRITVEAVERLTPAQPARDTVLVSVSAN